MSNIKEVNIRIDLYKQLPQNSVGAEIGVCKGKNALNMYNTINPKLMYLVDIWEKDELTYVYHPPELYYDDWESEVRKMFTGKNVEIRKQFSIEFLSSLPAGHLDWVYLDSDHSYENISKEPSLKYLK